MRNKEHDREMMNEENDFAEERFNAKKKRDQAKLSEMLSKRKGKNFEGLMRCKNPADKEE